MSSRATAQFRVPQVSHLPRFLAALLLAVALAGPATPAFGWGNGGGANGGDGYGTHDWIVDAAVAVLDGKASDWFDAEAARLASDDPDTVEDRGTRAEHVYRDSGRRGGAVARISLEFDVATAAYQRGVAARDAGDAGAATDAFRDASRHIGLLAHFVGDLAQPFHTATEGIALDSLHFGYEALVGAQQRSPDSRPEWRSPRRTVDQISNIRKTAIATAAYSRSHFADVYAVLTTDGVVLTPELDAITGLLMQRAANDLADIIWSISRGVGAAPAASSLSMSVRWTGVIAGGSNTVSVRAHDARGRPIEGLAVVVAWPTSTGTRPEYLYTDATGYQSRSAGVGTRPKLVLRRVVATSTVREAKVTASRSWTISPRLASGSAGFKTIVSDATVVPGQIVRVTSIARDSKGRGVPNLLVTWTWTVGGTTVRTSAYTGSTGRASSTQVVSTTTTMARVTVTARTQSGSTNRSSSTSFRRVS
jgi:hypothetical protein